MNYPQSWEHSVPEAIYNPASSASISSYFVRPNKVVKSSSHNGSPKNLGRRKTTTSATISARTRSMVDHLRSNSQQWPRPTSSHSRPVSWHPNSVDFNAAYIPTVNSQDLSSWNFSTAQVHGLITPISFPAVNEPQIKELITPLDEFPGQNSALTYENHYHDDRTWLSLDQCKDDFQSHSTIYQPMSAQPSWGFNQQSSQTNVQTAPSSPIRLPTQNINLDTLCFDSSDMTMSNDQDELVGMGLYDSPAEVQSSSLLFGNSPFLGKKGLKLAESFEPLDCENDDDDDDEEVEQEDSSAQEKEDAEDKDESDGEFSYASAGDNPLSTTSHLLFDAPHEADPAAVKYLATLGQFNNPYFPARQSSYNWI